MKGQDYKKTWTQEEAEYVRKIGNEVKSQGLSIVNELPRLFHEKFQTHTDEAVVTYWNSHYSSNLDEERNARKEEARCLKEYIESRRRLEEKLKARRKKMQELRQERLQKARATYGGYSVG